jgi:hypothetical protein
LNIAAVARARDEADDEGSVEVEAHGTRLRWWISS